MTIDLKTLGLRKITTYEEKDVKDPQTGLIRRETYAVVRDELSPLLTAAEIMLVGSEVLWKPHNAEGAYTAGVDGRRLILSVDVQKQLEGFELVPEDGGFRLKPVVQIDETPELAPKATRFRGQRKRNEA